MRTQDIAFGNNQLVLLFLGLSLKLAVLDYGVQFANFSVEVLDLFLILLHLLLVLFDKTAVLLDSLVLLLVLYSFLHQCYFLRIDLFFQLINLVVHNLVASLNLSNLIFSFGEVLAVGISVRTDCFV